MTFYILLMKKWHGARASIYNLLHNQMLWHLTWASIYFLMVWMGMGGYLWAVILFIKEKQGNNLIHLSSIEYQLYPNLKSAWSSNCQLVCVDLLMVRKKWLTEIMTEYQTGLAAHSALHPSSSPSCSSLPDPTPPCTPSSDRFRISLAVSAWDGVGIKCLS